MRAENQVIHSFAPRNKRKNMSVSVTKRCVQPTTSSCVSFTAQDGKQEL